MHGLQKLVRGDLQCCCLLNHAVSPLALSHADYLECQPLSQRPVPSVTLSGSLPCAKLTCCLSVLPTAFLPVAFNRKRLSEIDIKLVQRINISFCVKLGWTLDATFESLQAAYSALCLHRKTTKFWFDSFINGRTRLVDQERVHKRRTGRSLANIQIVQRAIEADRTLTLATLRRQTDIPMHTIQRILTRDLQLRRRSARLVPAALTPNHLCQRLDCAQSMLRVLRRTPAVMKWIVMIDETFVYLYDPESKVQSS